jgi:hypothetical protein
MSSHDPPGNDNDQDVHPQTDDLLGSVPDSGCTVDEPRRYRMKRSVLVFDDPGISSEAPKW